MKIVNKPIILGSDGSEEALEINAIYEFQIDNLIPKIGKLVRVSEQTITFDCSGKYKSHLKDYKMHRVNSIRKVADEMPGGEISDEKIKQIADAIALDLGHRIDEGIKEVMKKTWCGIIKREITK
jgi:hypothetical protein